MTMAGGLSTVLRAGAENPGDPRRFLLRLLGTAPFTPSPTQEAVSD